MKRTILYYIILFSLVIISAGGVQAKQYDVDNIEMVYLANETKYVCNPENILSQSTVASIDSLFRKLETTTGIETVVVVVDSLRVKDCYLFSMQLGEKYGVGGKTTNGGLIITLSTSDRCTQILTGRGLEGDLPDAICRRIQVQNMNEFLKVDDYDKAMLSCAQMVCSYLDGTMMFEPESTNNENGKIFVYILIYMGIIILYSVLTYYYKKRCPNCKKFKLEENKTLMLKDDRSVRITETIYVCKNCQCNHSRKKTYYKKKDYHTGGYGGGLGGGFGGGPSGGSFGGGSFGGGGSSWKF